VKKEDPEYLAVSASEVPQMQLRENSGWLKVIMGSYEKLVSKVPNYSTQFLYHIHLLEGKKFSLPTEAGLEYAVFLPQQDVTINDTLFTAGDFIEFDRESGTIEIIPGTHYCAGALCDEHPSGNCRRLQRFPFRQIRKNHLQ
jgi:hypothetical protein